jgi:hypothetical protein
MNFTIDNILDFLTSDKYTEQLNALAAIESLANLGFVDNDIFTRFGGLKTLIYYGGKFEEHGIYIARILDSEMCVIGETDEWHDTRHRISKDNDFSPVILEMMITPNTNGMKPHDIKALFNEWIIFLQEILTNFYTEDGYRIDQKTLQELVSRIQSLKDEVALEYRLYYNPLIDHYVHKIERYELKLIEPGQATPTHETTENYNTPTVVKAYTNSYGQQIRFNAGKEQVSDNSSEPRSKRRFGLFGN